MTVLAVPSHLNKGSKGGWVRFVQLLLAFFGWNQDGKLDLSGGLYDDATEKCAKRAQRFQGLKADGHWGPDSRRRFKDLTGLDLNEVHPRVFKYSQTEELIFQSAKVGDGGMRICILKACLKAMRMDSLRLLIVSSPLFEGDLESVLCSVQEFFGLTAPTGDLDERTLIALEQWTKLPLRELTFGMFQEPTEAVYPEEVKEESKGVLLTDTPQE